MSYEWITPAMFAGKLEEILDRMSGAEVLSIPGVYDHVSEELNNQVLQELEEERGEKETETT